MNSLKEQAVVPSLKDQVIIPENGLSPVIPEQGSDRYKVLILDPDDGSLVEVEKWKQDPNPQRAEAVVILRSETHDALVVSKRMSENEFTFDAAQAHAATFAPSGLEGATFRCPTRREVLDIFDADDYGFDEAVRLIAGSNDWYNTWGWTCEKVSRWWALRYYANSAWYFYGATRTLDSYPVYYTYQVGAVTLLKFK